MLNIIMDQETSSIVYNLIITIEIFLIDFYVFMDPNIFPGKVRRLTSSDWICNGSFFEKWFPSNTRWFWSQFLRLLNVMDPNIFLKKK